MSFFKRLLKRAYEQRWVMALLNVLFFLVRATEQVLAIGWTFFPSLLFILIGTYAFWYREEGVDILQGLTERPSYVFSMVLTVYFWAATTWYSSWLVAGIKKIFKTVIIKRILRLVPPILGTSCFLVIYFALLRFQYPGYRNNGLGTFLYFITLLTGLITGALLYRKHLWKKYRREYADEKKRAAFLNRIKRKTLVITLSSIALYLATWGMGFLRLGSEAYTLLLMLLFLALGAGFLVILAHRSILTPRLKLKARKPGPFRFLVPDDKMVFRTYRILAFLCLIIFILSVEFVSVSMLLGTLSGLLLAFSVLLAIINFFSFFSVQLRFNIHFVLIFFAILLGTCNDPYNVRVRLSEVPVDQRPDIITFFKQWVEDHKTEIDSAGGKGYPVFLVITHGGACRSGYWTAGTLGTLEDTSADHRKFSRHLFAVAGASGGSFGNAVFLSMLKRKQEEKLEKIAAPTRSYLAGDFLSYTLNHMTGPDFINHIYPALGVEDRAAALELSMEYDGFLCHEPRTAEIFSEPFLDLWKTKDGSPSKLPAMFVNTTRVQDAKPGVISNIDLDEEAFPGIIDVLSLLRKDEVMNLSTAVVMGARFPYVSPAGRIDSTNSYFVDGGYFDNSGAMVMLDALLKIKEYVRMNKGKDPRLGRLRFHLIHIVNSRAPDPKLKRINPFLNDLAAPLLTMAGLNTRQTEFSNNRLIQQFDQDVLSPNRSYYKFDLFECGRTADSTREVFPMSWYISRVKREEMDRAVSICAGGPMSLVVKLLNDTTPPELDEDAVRQTAVQRRQDAGKEDDVGRGR